MHNKSFFLLLFFQIFGALTCSQALAAKEPLLQSVEKDLPPLNIVASIRPLALIARDIAGNEANIRVLVDGASSPHGFSLSIRQALNVQEADLVLKVGSGVDTFLDALPQTVPIVSFFSEASDHNHEHAHDDEAHHNNAHPWLDANHAQLYAAAMAEKIIALRPLQKEQVTMRLEAFRARIVQAQQSIQDQLLPLRTVRFAVFHNAYTEWVAVNALAQPYVLTNVPHERLSAKRLNAAGKALKQASCLLVELAAEQEAERIARLFDVPLVTADILAQDPEIKDYAAFLIHIGAAFELCLSALRAQ